MLRSVAGGIALSCLCGSAMASDLLTFRDVPAGNAAYVPVLLSVADIDWLRLYAQPEAQYRSVSGIVQPDAETRNFVLAVTAGLPRFEMPTTIRQQY